MKKERIKYQTIKSLTEQVEDHFKYMSHKGVHKCKLTPFKDPLWRPKNKYLQ